MAENEKNEVFNKDNKDTPDYYVNETINKVETILKKHFPDYISFGYGIYTIHRGSTQVMLNVKHLVKDETVIVCFSNVVTGAQIDSKLMHYLMRKNAELHFGAFAILFDGTITFSHSITGSNLDANELITTLSSVAYIADYYDDILIEMAGGLRANDH
jgi:hypothetical protein